MDVKPRSENKKAKGVVHGVVGGETGKETTDVASTVVVCLESVHTR